MPHFTKSNLGVWTMKAMANNVQLMARVRCEIVESSAVPGEYCVEITHRDDEGKISTVRFESHDSKRLAEEYLAWRVARG